MERFPVQKADTKRFIQNLKHYPLTKQQIKTLRGQALAGDLIGARKGLERTIAKHEYNRAV